MKRLIILSFVSCFVIILLIGGTVIMGHSQLPSPSIQRLHLTDCNMPCWNEITLGGPTSIEVVKRLNKTFGLNLTLNFAGDMSDNFIINQKSQGQIRVDVDSSRQSIWSHENIMGFVFTFSCDVKHCAVSLKLV